MRVILHAGVHCTDEDRLLKCLLRNGDDLRREGMSVPGPSRYRTLMGEVVNAMASSAPHPNAREALLDSLLDMPPETTKRLFLSNPNLFSVPRLALEDGVIYRRAEERLARIAQLFRGDTITLFLGLRDFASLVPALHATTPHSSVAEVLGGADPTVFRWSDFLRRLRAALPEIQITVWCNEDTPILWGQIVREAAGLPIGRQIIGAFDVFSDIVSEEGMRRFRAFLKDNPAVTEAQKRRAMIALLERYVLPEAIEEELDLPGWSQDLVQMLGELYDADLDEIDAIPGVRLILP